MAREVRISDDAEAEVQSTPLPPPSGRPSVDGNAAASAAVANDEDDRTGLVHIVVGNLMMAQREQSQLAANASGASVGTAGNHFQLLGEWSRVMVGYLMVLCVWMWESPRSVKEFLSEGSNIQVVSNTATTPHMHNLLNPQPIMQLIQPITQTSGVDSLVQGLCAFLLGIVYEYNREPGSVTRATLHPILQSHVGPDVFANRILRLREDVRFKNVGPDVLELSDDADAAEDGVWFDWAFVEFLKNNYCKIGVLARALGWTVWLNLRFHSVCAKVHFTGSWANRLF